MSTRIEREKAFHNERFQKGTRGFGETANSKQPGKFYTLVLPAFAFHRNLLRRSCEGKRVLELGCGIDCLAFSLKKAAQVIGIDISEVAVEKATKKARQEGLEALTFRVMNAEDLAFDDSEFDIICGNAILHHLDLRKVYAELARTMKPSGVALFLEPLGHNPLINLYRKLTPELRTPDEHPFLKKDLNLAKAYFGQVDLRFYNLFSLLAIFIPTGRCFHAVHRLLNAADKLLFRFVPLTRRYAWNVLLVLSQPRKEGLDVMPVHQGSQHSAE
jgi:SAM-dependent methyltransferase